MGARYSEPVGGGARLTGPLDTGAGLALLVVIVLAVAVAYVALAYLLLRLLVRLAVACVRWSTRRVRGARSSSPATL